MHVCLSVCLSSVCLSSVCLSVCLYACINVCHTKHSVLAQQHLFLQIGQNHPASLPSIWRVCARAHEFSHMHEFARVHECIHVCVYVCRYI